MSLRLAIVMLVVATAALGYFAMKRGSSAPEPVAESGAPPAVMPSAPTTDAGIAWDAPSRWMASDASGMRLATYSIPGPGGSDPAECAVYYFGPGQGGGVDANIQRWIGEFENPGAHNVATREVAGMKVSQVRITGTYRAHAMGATSAPDEHEDWGLLGAVVEGPNGDLFFKLTGPGRTVDGASKEFDAMLGSLKPR